MKPEEIENLNNVDSVEKLKLKLDYERIGIERLKAWLTAVSIFIPLAAAALSIGYGIQMENKREKTNFEIKAVEIVMNASSPMAATNKAVVLSQLFPDRLPKDFKEKMLAMYGKSQEQPKRE
jgi:hypothetical protein